MNNEKLEKFKNEIKGKKVAALGIGISNVPVIENLVKLGALVSARDKKEKISDEIKKLEKIGVEFVLGDKYLDNLENYDYIFRSPGIKPFTYEIQRAVELGKTVFLKRFRYSIQRKELHYLYLLRIGFTNVRLMIMHCIHL